jgi:hypothetical protein
MWPLLFSFTPALCRTLTCYRGEGWEAGRREGKDWRLRQLGKAIRAAASAARLAAWAAEPGVPFSGFDPRAATGLLSCSRLDPRALPCSLRPGRSSASILEPLPVPVLHLAAEPERLLRRMPRSRSERNSEKHAAAAWDALQNRKEEHASCGGERAKEPGSAAAEAVQSRPKEHRGLGSPEE